MSSLKTSILGNNDQRKVPEQPAVWFILPFLGICFAVFMNLLLAFLGVTLAEDPVADNSMLDMFRNRLVLLVLIEAVIAPILEELLFRRLIFGLMRRFLPLYVAALITSVLFGVLHFNLPQGLYGFFFSFLLCEVMVLYGTWIAPLIVHASANALALFMNYVPSVNAFMVEHSLIILVIAGILTAGLAVIMELRIRRKEAGENG